MASQQTTSRNQNHECRLQRTCIGADHQLEHQHDPSVIQNIIQHRTHTEHPADHKNQNIKIISREQVPTLKNTERTEHHVLLLFTTKCTTIIHN